MKKHFIAFETFGEPICTFDHRAIKPCVAVSVDNVARVIRIPSELSTFPNITNVIFNPPATIVFWDDDTKTVVKCREGDRFDKETGLAMAVIKKLSDGKHHKIFKRWCKDEAD